MSNNYDILIIGAGPAGSAAAIYAKRAGFSTVILGGHHVGGQLVLTDKVDNYPGFHQMPVGFDLIAELHSHVKKFEVEISRETVSDINFSKPPFVLTTESGAQFTGKALIVATGAQPRWLGLEGESKYLGNGMSACPTCDGFFYKNKNVCVVGNKDVTLEEALFLTKFASSVKIIHLREDSFLKQSDIYKHAASNPKIQFVLGEVTAITGDAKVEGLELKNPLTGEAFKIACDGFFVVDGTTPESQLFLGKLEMDDGGHIITNRYGATSVEGVFAGGDVMQPHHKQAVVAAGTGALAAMEAIRYLNRQTKQHVSEKEPAK